MDHIKFLGTGHHSCHYGIVVDLLQKIIGIASRKLNAPQVIGAHVVEIGIYMIPQTEVLVGIHYVSDAALHIFAADISPCDRNLRGTYDLGKALILVAEWLWYDKCYVHVATLPHSSGETIAGGAKTSENVRGEFPPKHELRMGISCCIKSLDCAESAQNFGHICGMAYSSSSGKRRIAVI